MNLPLRGCTVLVTREERGELGRLLEDAGASVVHVPLIEVLDADRADVEAGWATEPDWVVVTSAAGADRVGTEAADRPGVRLAAVGTATARRLGDRAGRPVDLVPARQLAEILVEEFNRRNPRPQRVFVAHADRAATTLVDGLREAGHDVTAAVAYRTVLRSPDDRELASIDAADAVVFASGSAALGWAEALGDRAADALPPIVAAIGPTTATVAAEAGLTVTHVASDHSLAGVIDTLTASWSSAPD